MTTPSSADLRTWARENGHRVATRGRVSNEIRSAWESAQTPVRRKRRPAPSPAGTGASPTASDHGAPANKGLLAVAAMAERLAALTGRVDALESRVAGKSKKKRKKQSR